MKKTLVASLTIHEAMDNLSLITDIDPEDPYRIGIVKNHKFILQDEEHDYKSIIWLTPESGQDILDTVKETYKSILIYLKDAYQSTEVDWKSPKTKKGLKSMMTLVGEAANKLDLITSNVESKLPKHSITESKEYKELQAFYLDYILKKLEGGEVKDESWSEDWLVNDDALLLDIEKRGLKDFETVRRDKEYELFYLLDDEGKPFFQTSLLRNIKLFCDFDESIDVSYEDDPLLRITSMKDRDLQAAAAQMLKAMEKEIKEFYLKKIRLKNNDLIRYLNKAIMALMLTSNQGNLLQNTVNKNCLRYFEDFQYFLRMALSSVPYQKLIAYPPDENDKLSNFLLKLAHLFCFHLFTRSFGVKQEMIGYIHRLSRKGEEIKKKERVKLFSETSIWNEFLQSDDSIQKLLKCYPNGPLFKVLDFIRKDEEKHFEPILQENLPFELYDILLPSHSVIVLRVPTPTRQSIISKAEIVEEFRGFLKFYALEKRKHLFFNLQDRTSWKEHARAVAIESLQNQAEYSNQIKVLTLPKDTVFYYQVDEYLDIEDHKAFINLFLEQLKAPDDCGFCFPKGIKNKEILDFAKKIFPLIHKYCFSSKKKLSRQERMDFIEIFYQFFSLKVIDLLKPDSLSFTCKDAVDIGASEAGGMYALLKFLSGKEFSKEDKEYLRWIFYAPALFIRERGVDSQRLYRMISALAVLETTFKKGKKEFLKNLSSIYSDDLINKMEIAPHLVT